MQCHPCSGTRPASFSVIAPQCQRQAETGQASEASARLANRSVRHRARQMRHAILLTVARDAELEVGIAQLRRAASRAAMQRFIRAAALHFELLPAATDILPMAHLMKNLWSEKQEVIR